MDRDGTRVAKYVFRYYHVGKEKRVWLAASMVRLRLPHVGGLAEGTSIEDQSTWSAPLTMGALVDLGWPGNGDCEARRGTLSDSEAVLK